MSKRRKARSRKARQQASIRNTVILVVVIGLAIGGIILLGSGSAGPEVSDERLNYEPVLGNPGAAITLIEYGAYGCEACRGWHEFGFVEQVLTVYPTQVKFVYRDNPVTFPAYSNMTAQIAQCALDQDETMYWQLHNALYTTIPMGSTEDTVFNAAEQIGLDMNALRACYQANTHILTILFDANRASRLGITGTPGWVIDDQRAGSSPDAIMAQLAQLVGTP